MIPASNISASNLASAQWGDVRFVWDSATALTLITIPMPTALIEFCGWLPAVIIPMATLLQLSAIVRKRSAEGVDWLTWFLFGVANVGLYIYTEKYWDIQSVVGLLGSALMDFTIAILVLANYGIETVTEPSQD